MIIDSQLLDENTTIDADICIVGGGVAGIVLANELLDKFNHIVLLESGTEEYSATAQALYAPAVINPAYPNPNGSRMRLLGGSSNHWENNTSELSPLDFKVRNWVADSGWPISYEDVAPFYPKAGMYCGTKEDGYQTAYWAERLKEQDLLKDSSTLETAIAKAANPATRFFAAHSTKLLASDTLSLYKNATFVDAKHNHQSQQIEHVSFESYPGIRHKVRAKAFIMCLGGIENARMLLVLNKQNEDRLGNRYDNVGRYFMDHPVVRAAHLYPLNRKQFGLYKPHQLPKRTVLGFMQFSEQALVKQQINNLRMPVVDGTQYMLSDGISAHHTLTTALKEGELPNHFGKHLINYIKDFDMVIEAISRKAFNHPVFDDADAFVGFQLPVMVEQTPSRANRIKLGERKDPYGIDRIEIDWELKASDKALMWRALEIAASEMGAQSLGRVRLLKEREERIFDSQMGFGHHHMGTTRMSHSDKKGVVNADQKVFGAANLYISGSSVFPTGGHVPPTLTLTALSIRLAQHIIRRFANTPLNRNQTNIED